MPPKNNYPIFARMIVRYQNRYLLIKEVKNAFYNVWNFPGGKVENNEDIATAAARELKEEINLTVSNYNFLHEGIYTYAHGGTWNGFYYLADIASIPEIHINEPEKCHGYCWLPIEEIKKLSPLGITSDILDLLP